MTLVVCLFQHWDRISDNESRKSHFIYIDILIYWYIDIELLFIQHIQVIRCFPAQEETVSTRCDRNRENRYTSNRIIQPLRGTRTCSQQPSPHQEVDTEKKRIWTAPTPAELTSVRPHSSSHFCQHSYECTRTWKKKAICHLWLQQQQNTTFTTTCFSSSSHNQTFTPQNGRQEVTTRMTRLHSAFWLTDNPEILKNCSHQRYHVETSQHDTLLTIVFIIMLHHLLPSECLFNFSSGVSIRSYSQ